ncbi:hypothetical protein [Arsenicibacter rosenii]|uniref:Carboxypeptidase-like regulatory domain-containing protein n=1 Tax=Arsenicibacter rosenii TaxID=1750698 RepID=A0A1S2VHZ0_9BACT|nr:hypothetical protein [Arsenicibacter rosenii]OIN58362.1 hypothetical protein BLX24_15325 [Arsenicibacter rosenii]
MRYLQILILLLPGLWGSIESGYAQGKYVIGTVIDRNDSKGVDKGTVTNKRTRQRVRTNTAGRFFITALAGDSLIFTHQAYGSVGIKWDGADNPVINARPLPKLPDRVYELKEVTITAKRYEEVKREIQQELMAPVASRKVTGEQAFDRVADGAGITLLYELFSKRAKGERKAAALMQEYKRHKLAMERLRLLIEQATSITAAETDAFVAFCDLNDDYLLVAEDYDLIVTLQNRERLYRVGYRNVPSRSRIKADPESN